MSSICSDIFNINKCKLKNREKPKSYNYIYSHKCGILHSHLSSHNLACTQAKLIKSSLGLPKCCRNTPLLKALSIKKIERILQVQQLTLMKNAMISNSKARSFYLHTMRKSHSVKNGNLFLRCNDL